MWILLDHLKIWLVVEFTASTSADSVILLFTCVFNMYGISEEIKLDTGPLLNGPKFSKFAQEQGFLN